MPDFHSLSHSRRELGGLGSDLAVILGPLLHVHEAAVGVGGALRVGVGEQFLDAEEDLLHVESRAPALLAQDAQTDAACGEVIGTNDKISRLNTRIC